MHAWVPGNAQFGDGLAQGSVGATAVPGIQGCKRGKPDDTGPLNEGSYGATADYGASMPARERSSGRRVAPHASRLEQLSA